MACSAPEAASSKAFELLLSETMGRLDLMFNGTTKPPKKVGLCLLVFPYNEARKMQTNYVSNGASRADMAVMFREMAARFEGGAGGEGHG